MMPPKQPDEPVQSRVTLLNNLKFHYDEVNRIEDELCSMCKAEIEPLIAEGKVQEAKDAVTKFFEGYSDYSIGRDMIIATLNRRLLSVKAKGAKEKLSSRLKEAILKEFSSHAHDVYLDGETYTLTNRDGMITYTASEYRELFNSWYMKILPFLKNNDEHGVLATLLEWDGETLAKLDMYSLIRKYFHEKQRRIS